MNPSKQTIADVAMIARNAIDRMIELESNKLDIQRKWVGLTDEEATQLWESTDNKDSWELLKRVEAKLKEKNT